MRWFLNILAAVLSAGICVASEPVLEPPTLHCIGVYWITRGDGVIAVEYRKVGDAQWQRGYPLFRVERGAHVTEKYGTKLDVPADATLYAGSVVGLTPDAAYELRLTPAGAAPKVLTARTLAEPVAPKNAPQHRVTPGDFAAAQKRAQPGDVFVLEPGVYEGAFLVQKSGEPGKPIIWRGSGAGEAIIDGKKLARAISANDVHDVWFENLTIRNADYGIVAHNAANLVVRRCRIRQCNYGFTATRNDRDATRNFFIADNVIEGPCTWPRAKGIENPRGIQVTGAGHVVCYNRIRGFADAIDTFPSPRCAAIDFHNNDISECTDDGIEMDYSERNTRCYENRFTNIFQGISVQPVFGGPVYIFRNALYNVVQETFKMHNSPSGALFFHNTSVKRGMPLILQTGEKVRHCILRNNLFIGTTANYAYESTAPMADCDFDYDGFGGGPWPMFLKWNGARYKTLADVKAKSPVEKHAVHVAWTGAPVPDDSNKQHAPADLRLPPGSAAIGAGEIVPNFTGTKPDLGAYESGAPFPHYGPRPHVAP